MSIQQLHIGNFKGFGKEKNIKIKPLTIFVGANSSGKSSCIHALASLSQTLKLPNNTTPLVLDDEYANVHLGRFIDVIHSRSYQDFITLGVSLDNPVRIPTFDKKDEFGSVSGIYKFKCTKKTQNIRVESAELKIGKLSFTLKWTTKGYTLTNNDDSTKFKVELDSGFLIDQNSIFTAVLSNDFDSVKPYLALMNAQNAIVEELSNICYLGPFRESPRRRYPTRGANPTEVGSMGESAVTMLANESFQKKNKPNIKQIEVWLQGLGLSKGVNLSRVGTSDLVDIKLTLNDGVALPIADLGYGLSQIMPVLTQCSFAKKGATLLFEQPEIHLHTKSSRHLATVFIDTITKKNCSVILETHSPDLIKQFLVELRGGKISPDDIIIYKVSRRAGQTSIKELEIDTENDFDVYDNWESGISI